MRLTVLLGAGGVGKTTLAAAHAIALARAGRRVGLLGIDPSRRLETALGVKLRDEPVELARAPNCAAAILAPAETLRRWAGSSDPRLASSPLFLWLADRLATATDVIAAARIAEWAERDPSLDDLVVDTAPGLNAIEFLRRPQRLTAFFEGELARALRSHGAKRRIMSALARVSGGALLAELANFLTEIERPVEQLIARVSTARRWFVDGTARIVLVTTVRSDAATAALDMTRALASLGLAPAVTVVNRTVPSELAHLDLQGLDGAASVVARYAVAYATTQQRVCEALGEPQLLVPLVARADREGLDVLGEALDVP